MKLFAFLIISIVLINVYLWVENQAPADIVLPTSKQLNEMVGRTGVPRVPLWLADAGN